jgi:hypothetical protein
MSLVSQNGIYSDTQRSGHKFRGIELIYPNTNRKCYLSPMKQNVISNNQMPGQKFGEFGLSKDPFNHKHCKTKNIECEASNDWDLNYTTSRPSLVKA